MNLSLDALYSAVTTLRTLENRLDTLKESKAEKQASIQDINAKLVALRAEYQTALAETKQEAANLLDNS
jgi:predicted  nucleic acid-binding Zn-ribbon protein